MKISTGVFNFRKNEKKLYEVKMMNIQNPLIHYKGTVDGYSSKCSSIPSFGILVYTSPLLTTLYNFMRSKSMFWILWISNSVLLIAKSKAVWIMEVKP